MAAPGISIRTAVGFTVLSMVKRKTGDGVSQHLVTTPARLKREKNKRQREEAYWASKCGPVTVTQIPVDPGSDQG